MKIEKDNIRIRSTKLDDARLLNSWWNDGEVMAHAGFPNGLGQSLEETKDGIRSWEGKLSQLCIIEIDGKRVGELNYRLDGDGLVYPGWKICELTYQNKGYGTKIINLLFQFLFLDEKINEFSRIDKIVWDTMLDNERARYLYKHKIGAREIAIKENSWKDQVGNLRTSVEYEITREEFFYAR